MWLVNRINLVTAGRTVEHGTYDRPVGWLGVGEAAGADPQVGVAGGPSNATVSQAGATASAVLSLEKHRTEAAAAGNKTTA